MLWEGNGKELTDETRVGKEMGGNIYIYLNGREMGEKLGRFSLPLPGKGIPSHLWLLAHCALDNGYDGELPDENGLSINHKPLHHF